MTINQIINNKIDQIINYRIVIFRKFIMMMIRKTKKIIFRIKTIIKTNTINIETIDKISKITNITTMIITTMTRNLLSKNHIISSLIRQQNKSKFTFVDVVSSNIILTINYTNTFVHARLHQRKKKFCFYFYRSSKCLSRYRHSIQRVIE